MDAVPVTLGQEFGGYAAQVRQGIARMSRTRCRGSARSLSAGRRRALGSTRMPSSRPSVRDYLSVDTGLTSPPRRTIRGPGGARRPRRGVRRAQGRRRLAHEDRERPPADGLGAARGALGDLPARAAEGQLDHARQGQPGDPRGRDPGRRPGDRQRHGDHVGGMGGHFELNVYIPLMARNLLESIELLTSAAPARREVRRRDRGEPRAERAVRGEHARGRDRAQPVHRLRQGVGDREGSERVGSLVTRGRARGRRRGERPRRGARLPRDGEAARLTVPRSRARARETVQWRCPGWAGHTTEGSRTVRKLRGRLAGHCPRRVRRRLGALPAAYGADHRYA